MSADTPLISVLLPVHNAQRYIAAAVASVLEQTFDDFELIITDDGSTDDSLRILQRFAMQDPRVHLVSRPNTGYVVALNEMLAVARGDLLARMDADDVSHRRRFEHQVAYLRRYPECICLGTACRLIDEDDHFIADLPSPLTHEAIWSNLRSNRNAFCHPSVMLRRRAMTLVGGYRTELSPCEDFDLWLRLSEVGNLANLPQPLLAYRAHAESVSSKNAELQAAQHERAYREAMHRRGLQPSVGEHHPVRSTRDRASRCAESLRFGWWAYKSQRYSTALRYAAKSLRAWPLTSGSWKLAAKSLLRCSTQRLWSASRDMSEWMARDYDSGQT